MNYHYIYIFDIILIYCYCLVSTYLFFFKCILKAFAMKATIFIFLKIILILMLFERVIYNNFIMSIMSSMYVVNNMKLTGLFQVKTNFNNVIVIKVIVTKVTIKCNHI